MFTDYPLRWIVRKPSITLCWTAGRRNGLIDRPSQLLLPHWTNSSGVQSSFKDWHRAGTHWSTNPFPSAPLWSYLIWHRAFRSKPGGGNGFEFHFGLWLFVCFFLSILSSRRPAPINPYYTTIPSMHTLPLGMPSLPNISNMPIPTYAMQPNQTWGTLHWA